MTILILIQEFYFVNHSLTTCYAEIRSFDMDITDGYSLHIIHDSFMLRSDDCQQYSNVYTLFAK